MNALQYSWKGHRIAFTRRGTGPAVLMLHSIHAAASAAEWDGVAQAVADAGYTVYTLDLPGFGESERPDIRYSARLYLSMLADFCTQVIGQPVRLVGSWLSAAYAIALATRDPGRYPAIVAVEPAGLTRLHRPPSIGRDVARIAVSGPLVGTAMFNGMVTRRALRVFLESCMADRRRVTDAMVDAAYETSHQTGARFAPAALAAGELNVNIRDAVRTLRTPLMLVWGQDARLFPVEESIGFGALHDGCELVIMDRAGDLPHVERPAAFAREVIEFLSRGSDEILRAA